MKKIQLVLILLTLSIGSATYAGGRYEQDLGTIENHKYTLMTDDETVKIECLNYSGSFSVVVGQDRNVSDCKICGKDIPISRALEKTVADIKINEEKTLKFVITCFSVIPLMLILILIDSLFTSIKGYMKNRGWVK